MIGDRVEWAYQRDGKPTQDLRGWVEGVGLDGRNWRLLVRKDDGELVSVEAKDLKVVATSSELSCCDKRVDADGSVSVRVREAQSDDTSVGAVIDETLRSAAPEDPTAWTTSARATLVDLGLEGELVADECDQHAMGTMCRLLRQCIAELSALSERPDADGEKIALLIREKQNVIAECAGLQAQISERDAKIAELSRKKSKLKIAGPADTTVPRDPEPEK